MMKTRCRAVSKDLWRPSRWIVCAFVSWGILIGAIPTLAQGTPTNRISLTLSWLAADAQPASPAYKRNQQDGKDSSRRIRGRDLGQGLRDSGQPRVKADGDADGNGPGGSNEQRSIYPQKGRARALKQFHYLRPVHMP